MGAGRNPRTEARSGGCHCGRTRYRAAGAAAHVGYWHCRSCRGSSGAPFVAWATFEKAGFAFCAGVPGRYRSSGAVVRTFCPQCGTPLTYEHSATPSEIDVTLASLEEPEGLAPEFHIWVAHKLPWVVIEDGLPRYDESRESAT